LALVLQHQCEREPRARRRWTVPVGDGFANRLLECLLRAFSFAETDRELEINEPKLPRGTRIDIGAGLEIVRRHAELRSKPAQRLRGRLSRSRLDARDVGVRHTGGGQLSL